MTVTSYQLPVIITVINYQLPLQRAVINYQLPLQQAVETGTTQLLNEGARKLFGHWSLLTGH